jgi:hypothetical protein
MFKKFKEFKNRKVKTETERKPEKKAKRKKATLEGEDSLSASSTSSSADDLDDAFFFKNSIREKVLQEEKEISKMKEILDQKRIPVETKTKKKKKKKKHQKKITVAVRRDIYAAGDGYRIDSYYTDLIPTVEEESSRSTQTSNDIYVSHDVGLHDIAETIEKEEEEEETKMIDDDDNDSTEEKKSDEKSSKSSKSNNRKKPVKSIDNMQRSPIAVKHIFPGEVSVDSILSFSDSNDELDESRGKSRKKKVKKKELDNNEKSPKKKTKKKAQADKEKSPKRKETKTKTIDDTEISVKKKKIKKKSVDDTDLSVKTDKSSRKKTKKSDDVDGKSVESKKKHKEKLKEEEEEETKMIDDDDNDSTEEKKSDEKSSKSSKSNNRKKPVKSIDNMQRSPIAVKHIIPGEVSRDAEIEALERLENDWLEEDDKARLAEEAEFALLKAEKDALIAAYGELAKVEADGMFYVLTYLLMFISCIYFL